MNQLNIVTITTGDPDWLGFHCKRFVRLAKRAMPHAKYHILVVSDKHITKKQIKEHDVLSRFDVVKSVRPKKQVGYSFFNELRYSLLRRFKLDECLYIDPDVDICADMSPVRDMSKANIGWVRSPVCPQGFDGLINMLNLGGKVLDGQKKEIWNNSGMLYLRKDYLKEYRAAVNDCIKAEFTPRMIGNAAFNVMLRRLDAKDHYEIPYEYGVIWWERYEPMSYVVNELRQQAPTYR